MNKKSIAQVANEKIEEIRKTRDANIKAKKDFAKQNASKERPAPVKVGHVELTEESKKAFSLVVVRKDDGEFKAGDVIARPSATGYMSETLIQEILAIRAESKDLIDAIKLERNTALTSLSDEQKVARAEKIKAKIAEEEAKLAKRKAEYASLTL